MVSVQMLVQVFRFRHAVLPRCHRPPDKPGQWLGRPVTHVRPPSSHSGALRCWTRVVSIRSVTSVSIRPTQRRGANLRGGWPAVARATRPLERQTEQRHGCGQGVDSRAGRLRVPSSTIVVVVGDLVGPDRSAGPRAAAAARARTRRTRARRPRRSDRCAWRFPRGPPRSDSNPGTRGVAILEMLDDPQRLAVVIETAVVPPAMLVEHLLAQVTERRVAQVVGQRERLRRDPR